MMHEWLGKLKVGDMVILDKGYRAKRGRVAAVVRITKTQIVIDNNQGSRWRIKDGSPVASGRWGTASLRPVTQEWLDAIRQNRLAESLCCFSWQDLPLATLEAVAKLLKVGK